MRLSSNVVLNFSLSLSMVIAILTDMMGGLDSHVSKDR